MVALRVLPVVVLVGVATFVLALVRRRTVAVPAADHAEVVRVARRTRTLRALGLAVGAALALLVLVGGQALDALGRITSLAPAVLGAGVLLGTVVGELTARPRVGARRSAAVETRTVRGVLPRTWTALATGSATVLGAALLLGIAWGSADDLGRAGRSFAVTCTQVIDGTAVQIGSSRGPWPGSYYAVPLLGALLVLGLLAALALVAVVRRPRPSVDSLDLDTLLRRGAAANVLTATTFSALATLAPVALFIASGLADSGCASTPLQSAVGWAAWVVAPLALAGAAAALGMLLAGPVIRVADQQAAGSGVAAEGTPVR
ncbi:hypothetical protein [uncultured Phycicoccus sp.]|uniref:hypothetical protein n=1 Tax=uncultured Phycicoccus sp. TaxID=661422 RepID=UPI0026131BFC|nr:hypothetical protein [uncultured Phycicoccus sp.]